jgi:hypothetical protein
MEHLVDRLRTLVQHNTHDQSSDGQRGHNNVAIKAHANGADSFSPPAGVRSAAKRGLELRSKFGRGGTSVGIARGRDLSNGKAVSSSTIRRMNSFFARHAVDKRPDWSNPEKPSNGYIAHMLWGGDAGRAWASKISRHLDASKKERVTTKSKNKPSNPSLWAKAVAAAKRKYDVYPSRYANGYAARWYAKRGGTWTKEKQFRLKHGKHDQSSHGRRGGGGGGLAPATMGARPKKAVPTPGQLGMFDVFDAPTPTPAPTPAPVQPARRQVPVNQQHIDQHIKDIKAKIKNIPGPALNETQQARVEAITRRVAEHAEETHRLRQERLYDENGAYIATPEVRKAFYVEMVDRAKSIRTEVLAVFNGDNALPNDVSFAEYEAMGPGQGALQVMRTHAIGGTLLRETMRQVTPTVIPSQFDGPAPPTAQDTLTRDFAVSLTQVGAYVHLAPAENIPVSLQYLANSKRLNAAGVYEPATATTPAKVFLLDRSEGSAGVVQTVGMHELGHHVESVKLNATANLSRFVRARVGDEKYREYVDRGNEKAGDDMAASFKVSIPATPANHIPYSDTVYFKTGYGTSRSLPNSTRQPASIWASEYLSTMFENTHNQGSTKTRLDTTTKASKTLTIAVMNPANFDYMYAMTQY